MTDATLWDYLNIVLAVVFTSLALLIVVMIVLAIVAMVATTEEASYGE